MRSVSFLKQIKNSWLLIVFGLVALILWNTNLLFDRLKTEERKKMELWAMAQKESIQNLKAQVILPLRYSFRQVPTP